MSAFSGASQLRMSLETMVTAFSHPSSLTKLWEDAAVYLTEYVVQLVLRYISKLQQNIVKHQTLKTPNDFKVFNKKKIKYIINDDWSFRNMFDL